MPAKRKVVKSSQSQTKLVPKANVVSMKRHKTSTHADADIPNKTIPKRNADHEFIFPDHPEFRPNMSPEEVLRAGSFG
jgi:hypothetical protein